MRSRRAVAGLLALASPALLVGFWIGGAVGEVLILLLVGLFPVALIALGASSSPRSAGSGARWRRRSAGFLVLLFTLLAGSLGAVWMLRGRIEEMPWIGGLPLAAAIQLYGLWLVPLIAVALAYALTFDSPSGRRSDDPRGGPSAGSPIDSSIAPAVDPPVAPAGDSPADPSVESAAPAKGFPEPEASGGEGPLGPGAGRDTDPEGRRD